MCDAPLTSASFDPGIRSRNSCVPSSVTTSESFPRTSSVGTRIRESAISNSESKSPTGTSVLRVAPMNAGSQCQYQRPSGFWRSTFMSPAGFTRLGRFGVYAAIASAASSSVAKPSMPELMKSLMRWMPSGFDRWVMSTITSALDTTRSVLPSAMIAATPPSDAPTITGGRPSWSATAIASAAYALNE